MSKDKKKSGKDDGRLGAMMRSVEESRQAGKRDGVEACLRIVDAMDPTATRDDVAKAIRTEMKRRTWIE